MEEVDLSGIEDLSGRIDSLMAVSTSTSSREIFQHFMRSTHRVRRFAGIVGVSIEDVEPGQFRIAFEMSGQQLSEGAVPEHLTFDPELARLPVQRGGLIGELLRGDIARPRLLYDFDLHDDPILGKAFSHAHSVVVIPGYAHGRTVALSLSLFESREPPPPAVVDGALVSVNMLMTASRHLSSLERIEQLNTQLTVQLEEVARIQQALLPQKLPEIPGLELASSYLTSDRAGGDYYDFFELSHNRWGILIADASGHGPAAATVMAMLHAIMHTMEKDGAGPEEILQYANVNLCKAWLDGSFATAFFALYDPRRGTIDYSSAGHNPPVLKNGLLGTVRELNDAASLPLGIMQETRYERGSILLKPLDSLVLYTDGITEAFDSGREMFGTKRLADVLVGCTGAPDCTVESVHRALFAHTGKRTRADDQTIVTARFHGFKTADNGTLQCNLRPHVVIPA